MENQIRKINIPKYVKAEILEMNSSKTKHLYIFRTASVLYIVKKDMSIYKIRDLKSETLLTIYKILITKHSSIIAKQVGYFHLQILTDIRLILEKRKGKDSVRPLLGCKYYQAISARMFEYSSAKKFRLKRYLTAMKQAKDLKIIN